MLIETPKQQDAPESDAFDRENLRVLRGLMRPPRKGQRAEDRGQRNT